MTTQYAHGKIVTDGLVLCLDAADPNSYPGTGTAWNDLSGNNNSGSLVNGPTFSSGDGGSIVFDGVDDYCTLPNIDTYSSTAKFTIEGLVKPINGNWCRIFTNGSNGIPGGIAGFINTDLLVLTNSSKPYVYLRIGNSEIISTQVSTITWDSQSFIMYFSFSVDKSTREGSYFFKFSQNNGLIQQELSNRFTSGTSTSFVENRLGGETDNENFMNMNLYSFKIYNRVLTQSEVLQNYNAQKSRFGL